MKKRLCIICLLVLTLLTGSVASINTSVSLAATNSKPTLYLRTDTVDTQKGNNLAVDVLLSQGGTVYGRVVDKGTSCTIKDVLETDCSVKVKAGEETAVFLKNSQYEGSLMSNHKIGDVCDIYLVFVDNKGTKFGPYVFKDHVLSYFPSGDGSQMMPFQIWSPRHLYNILHYMEEGYHFKLMQHIDMENSNYSGRIGDYAGKFEGTLDGNHCVINHLKGQLFDIVGEKGLIHDLFLANIKVEQKGDGTILAAIADRNSGTIKDCSIHGGSVVNGAAAFVNLNEGTIKGCTIQEVEIEAEYSTFAGGIAGTNTGLIQDCYACPIIFGRVAVGGIVGKNMGTVSACSVSGATLFPTGRYIGGIAGINGDDAVLLGCISEWKPFDTRDENQGSIVSGQCGNKGGLLCKGNVMYPVTETTDAEGKPLTQEQIIEKQISFYMRHGDYNAENTFTTPAYYAVTWNFDHTFYRPLRIATIIWVVSCFETVEYNKNYPFTLVGGNLEDGSNESNAIIVKKATISKLTSKKAKQFTVTIKMPEAVDGYEIVYSTDKNFGTGVKKITKKQSTNTIKSLVGSKIYYVKVRAYKLDSEGNKVYGKYSTAKSVKTKK